VASPAERYAAAQRRAAVPLLQDFLAGYPFALDDFQRQACEALESGHGVLVAAPTGAGKTVVGEFAVHLALQRDGKCFYTTPIKALSNQKFHDLADRYGADRVGLLTGDNSINGEAPVVVMTTEVLRNMLYAESTTLNGLHTVVMDEVHYLADRFRGAVWEEVILHLSQDVQLVSLSATVSNAEEFGDWLQEVRGDTTVIVEEHRPVPLWQSVLVRNELHDLFIDDEQRELNPHLSQLAAQEMRFDRDRDRRRPQHGGPRSGQRGRPGGTPHRPDVVERLDHAGLLPAIVFLFSRAGCDAAVRQCVRAGLRLAAPEDRSTIREAIERRTALIAEEDLVALGYGELLDALERGIAPHHAGMIAPFKEAVEELFAAGLLSVVFATETLALGINMPARSVVLESLVKWNGEAHVDLTPGEYTQLTGRAGRRGIDVEGHAVVMWTPGFDPRHVASLASTRTYPLRSSFRPSYNMAVNLVGRMGRVTARELLETSFAQFQADRSVVGLARQVRGNNEALEGYRESMTCHLGDFAEYAALRRALSDRESELAKGRSSARRAVAATSVEALIAGDVIRLPGGRRAELAVVVNPAGKGPDATRLAVVTASRQLKRLSLDDFTDEVAPLGKVRIPRSFEARSPQARRDLVSSLRALRLEDVASHGARSRGAAADDAEIARLRVAIRQHPCHGCSDREHHARWAERYDRLRRDTDALERRMRTRTGTIAKTFDSVCDVLTSLGYLHEETVTPAGQVLARIYSESDLVVAEAIRDGAWNDLDAAELSAVVSALVYESRRDDEGAPRLPPGRCRAALEDLEQRWDTLRGVETDAGLSFLREPQLGFAWLAWRWAKGHPLDAVLHDTRMAPGDFIRWVKQLLDLLDQIAQAAPDAAPVRKTARTAVGLLRRGVVAYLPMD
jgi:ATP-dependent RNA helicase HelY